MNRLSSKAYRDASRGAPCQFRIPGVCTGGGEDTVFAHIRDEHTGRSIKASDISGADACFACHEVMDARARLRYGTSSSFLTDVDWLFYALRALQRTLEARIEAGVLGWPADKERPPKAVKPRKPKASRRSIPSRSFGQ